MNPVAVLKCCLTFYCFSCTAMSLQKSRDSFNVNRKKETGDVLGDKIVSPAGSGASDAQVLVSRVFCCHAPVSTTSSFA